MAFSKKTWTDRLSEYATRRILTDQDTGTVSVVEVARSEGTIYQQGDAFSAANMNDLEDRIAAGFTSVNNGLGPVEDLEGAASQAYPVNAYFVGDDGYFYKVIEAIDQGDAFVTTGTGANCTQTNVASELASGGGGGGGIRYVEEDDMVQLYYNGTWRDWKSGGMAYPVGTATNFSYMEEVQSFEIPATGSWKLEVWGAKGGNGYDQVDVATRNTVAGGNGGYAKGVCNLTSGDIIYIVTGGAGMSYATASSGGYNGGGANNISSPGSGQGGRGGAGGGATHIAINNGDLLKNTSIDDLLIVAGGGGGGGKSDDWSPYTVGAGGSGGGLTGGTGGSTYNASSGNGQGGTGGSQSAGGTGSQNGSYGQGGNLVTGFNSGGGKGDSAGAGGGGYYGGGAGYRLVYSNQINGGSGGGGSSYIKNTLTDTVTTAGLCDGAGHATITYLG
jgi:hypothetical protein